MSPAAPRARRATAEEWDAAWSTCPYATFFQARAWHEVWRDETDGALAPRPVLLTFDDGEQVVLPLSRRVGGRLGTSRDYESSPGGTYGGWLAPRPLDAARVSAVAAWLSRRCPGILWRWSPFAGESPALGDLPVREEHTHVLDLTGGFATVERGWEERTGEVARKLRYDLRHAVASGTSVRLAEGDGDWQAYLDCYAASLARWGERATSRYASSFFARLREAGGERVRLWLAEHGGRLVAGALCLEAPAHVVYWHGAAHEEAFSLRAVHLLVRESLRQACRPGRRWFDFNPSGGHAGVERFKSTFGTERLSCPLVVRRAPTGRLRRAVAAARSW